MYMKLVQLQLLNKLMFLQFVGRLMKYKLMLKPLQSVELMSKERKLRKMKSHGTNTFKG